MDSEDLDKLYSEANERTPKHHPPAYTPTLWELLALEGRHDLLTTLHHVELKTPGYGTVIVPEEGFSENTDTHNMVLNYLKIQGVMTLNVGITIARLQSALHYSMA
jgi:hypothetical protein